MPLLRQSKMVRRRKKREPTLAMTSRRYTQEDIAEARSRRLTARWASNPWKFVVWRAVRRGMKLRAAPHHLLQAPSSRVRGDPARTLFLAFLCSL
jgi:hypothetical protein